MANLANYQVFATNINYLSLFRTETTLILQLEAEPIILKPYHCTRIQKLFVN